jgi:hypothetical protein
MLGHIAVGAPCSCCNDTIDQRKTKRREQRQVEQEIAEGLLDFNERNPVAVTLTNHVTPEQSPLRQHIHSKVPRPEDGRPPVLAQVGWLGQTGGIYALDDAPYDSREPGGFAPLLIQIGTWEKDPESGAWFIHE